MNATNGTNGHPRSREGTTPTPRSFADVFGRHRHAPDASVQNRVAELVENWIGTRSAFFQRFNQGPLDLERVDEQCGYPSTYSMTGFWFRELYDRDPLACRVVQLMPKESWQSTPLVYETEEGDEPTEFEEAWDDLGQMLRGEACWYQDEEGSPVWEKLRRADILSGIGFFGILLLGVDDGRNLDQPVDGVMSLVRPSADPQAPPQRSEPFSSTQPTDLPSGAKKEVRPVTTPDGLDASSRSRAATNTENALGRKPYYTVRKSFKDVPHQPEHHVYSSGPNGLEEANQIASRHMERPDAKDVKVFAHKWTGPQGKERQKTTELRNRDEHGRFTTNVAAFRHYPSTVKGCSSSCGFINPDEGGEEDRWITANNRGCDNFTAVSQPQGMVVNAPTKPAPSHGPASSSQRDQGQHINPGEPTEKTARASDGTSPFTSFAGAQGTDAQYVGVQLSPPEYPSTEPSTEKRRLLFLRAFDESLVQIVQYEADVRNPRFAMPVMYRVTLNDPREQHSGVGLPLATVRVHWSRVIHLTDCGGDPGSSEIFSPPRMRPVICPILDARKIRGSSAAGYWNGNFMGLSFETNPQLGGDVAINRGELQEDVDKYFAGLDRALISSGMTVKTLGPQISDPTSHYNLQVEAICVQKECPVRVFKGAERGELASTQDDEDWNHRVQGRNVNYLTPRVIVPFIDRLISMGVLPVPKVGNKGDKGDATKKKALPGAGGAEGTPQGEAPGGLPGKEEGSAGGVGQSGRAKPGAPGDLSKGLDGGKASPFGDQSKTQFPLPGGPKPPVGNRRARNVLAWSTRNSGGLTVTRLIFNDGTASTKVQNKGGYSVEWPDIEALGAKDKAAILLQRTQAWAAYVAGGLEAVIPPHVYATKFDDMDDEQSEAMLDQAKAEQEANMTIPPAGTEGHPAAPPPPPPPLPPQGPIKVKPGEKLVQPPPAGPPKPPGGPSAAPKPPAPPTGNVGEVHDRIFKEIANEYLESDHAVIQRAIGEKLIQMALNANPEGINQYSHGAVAKSVHELNKRDSRTGLTPVIPKLHEMLQERHPGITKEEVMSHLKKMAANDQLTFQAWGGGPSIKQATGYEFSDFPDHPNRGKAAWVSTRNPTSNEAEGRHVDPSPPAIVGSKGYGPTGAEDDAEQVPSEDDRVTGGRDYDDEQPESSPMKGNGTARELPVPEGARGLGTNQAGGDDSQVVYNDARAFLARLLSGG